MRLDLHVHSDRSDGRHPPAEVLARALRNGLDVLALSDHDLPPALEPGIHRAGEAAVRVLAAAEVTGSHEGREFHLLVYFPGAVPGPYREFLRGQAQLRARRYDEAVARLGLALPPAGEDAHRGERALARTHLARGLVQGGHVPNLDGAWRLLAGPAKVPLVETPFVDCIRGAVAAGALTSWAHPALADAQRYAPEFTAAGLHALEAERPSLSRPTRNGLARLCKRLGLLRTGGSDWHGWWPGDLGDFAFRDEAAAAFLARLDA